MKYLKKFNEGTDEFNMTIQNFYSEYKTLCQRSYGSTELFTDIENLIKTNDLSKEEAEEILSDYDTDFDTDDILQSLVDNWDDEYVPSKSGSKEKMIAACIKDISDDGRLKEFIDNLSADDVDVLYNILAGSGELEAEEVNESHTEQYVDKPELKVEYFIDDDKFSDEEYEKQEFKEFIITEGMLIDLVSEKVELEPGQRVCSNNFFVNKI